MSAREKKEIMVKKCENKEKKKKKRDDMNRLKQKNLYGKTTETKNTKRFQKTRAVEVEDGKRKVMTELSLGEGIYKR